MKAISGPETVMIFDQRNLKSFKYIGFHLKYPEIPVGRRYGFSLGYRSGKE